MPTREDVQYGVGCIAIFVLLAVFVGWLADTWPAEAPVTPNNAVCMDASAWNANDGERPCVRVTRVYEDGSFVATVFNADQESIRYIATQGAKDR